jgi:hypothetical protein
LAALFTYSLAGCKNLSDRGFISHGKPVNPRGIPEIERKIVTFRIALRGVNAGSFIPPITISLLIIPPPPVTLTLL